MSLIWSYVASGEAALLFSLFVFADFIRRGLHKDESGKTDPERVILAGVQLPVIYMFLMAGFGNFLLKIPTTTTFKDGFGDDRVGYVIIGLGITSLAKLLGYYDRKARS